MSLLDESINCLDPNIGKYIQITDTLEQRARRTIKRHPIAITTLVMPDILRSGHVRLSLLDSRTGAPHARGGLNWGQRPKRDPNQAYIPVPSGIARARLFPPRGQHFTITTDDGKTFDAVIAQSGDKAIETPFDNSILGAYFRQRIGVPSGAYINLQDLGRYGRTDVDFLKIDSETYYMDFSV